MKNGKASKRILSVIIKRMIDDSPDTSWLDEYANRPTSEYSIDRAHSEDCIENNQQTKDKLERIQSWIENDRPICEEHTQFIEDACEVCAEEKAYTNAMDDIGELLACDCGERGDMERNQYRYFNPSFNYVDSNGHALPENTAEEVRSYVKQDYERMEPLNAGHWCFIGVQAVATFFIGHSGMQFFTSGGLWGIESDSGDSYLQEVEKEELADLREQLKAIGFSSRAISQAFKNVERKED